MQNKFGVSSLVRVDGDKTLVWKVVEVWDIAYIASISNKIQKTNQYVVTNVATMTAKIVPEASIQPIEVSDESGEEITGKIEKSSKAKK